MESRKQPLKSLGASQAHSSINKPVNDNALVVQNIDAVDYTSVLLIQYDELNTYITRDPARSGARTRHRSELSLLEGWETSPV